MTKAELEKRLAAAEASLKDIVKVCQRSGDDMLKEYNEDSLQLIGKAIFDDNSVYPLKIGEIQSKAIWAIADIRGISPLDDNWEAI